MNKSEFIAEVAKKAGLTHKQSEAAYNALLDTITEELKKGERVQLTGFGTFEIRERSARTGRNPATGEAMEIPASKTPAFKAGKKLKDLL